MSTMTLAQSIELTGKEVYDYLDRDALVPVVTRSARQGDVTILRADVPPAKTPIPAEGVIVVSGEQGHTHTLHGGGFFDRAPQRSGSLVIGTLTVPEGADVLLSHHQHGNALIAPGGTYTVGRQREFAGEWRMVAD